jgi:hypothetical protein
LFKFFLNSPPRGLPREFRGSEFARGKIERGKPDVIADSCYRRKEIVFLRIQ